MIWIFETFYPLPCGALYFRSKDDATKWLTKNEWEFVTVGFTCEYYTRGSQDARLRVAHFTEVNDD